MNFTQSIRACFKKFADFKGVASRPEYWYFYLFSFIGTVLFTITKIEALHVVWGLLLLLPSAAVAIRRFRDAGHNPLWVIVTVFFQLSSLVLGNQGQKRSVDSHGTRGASGLGAIVVVLLVLGIVTIVFLCQKSKLTGNKYYPDRADTSVIDTPVSTHQSNYCSNCGKLKLPGQTECASCGKSFAS